MPTEAKREAGELLPGLFLFVPLRLNINRARDERGNRFPDSLCGLLRRFKCGMGKDSPPRLAALLLAAAGFLP